MDCIESLKNWIRCHPYASLVPALDEGLISFVEFVKLEEFRKSYTKKTPPSKGRALGHSEAAAVQLNLNFE